MQITKGTKCLKSVKANDLVRGERYDETDIATDILDHNIIYV